MKRFLTILPIYTFLFIIFFIFHGYTTNYNIVPFKDSLVLIGIYFLVAAGMLTLFYFFFKNIKKSALLTLFTLAYQFFFGSLHDTLKELFPGTLITKYSFLLPASLISFIILIVYVSRRKSNFTRLTLYLNLLFLILILVDLITLVSISNKPLSKNETTEIRLTACDTCSKPDIYLIVADGYPGNIQLKDLFHFDNSKFENALRERGFFIVDSSRSNYNFTQHSIASMLSLSYLKGITHVNSNKTDIQICRDKIKNSPVISYFENEGYQFYNHSIFDSKEQPSIATPSFLTRKLEPITRHTFTYRIMKDLGYHLVTTLKIPFMVKKYLTLDLINNQKIYSATQKTVHKKANKPKFVYTHLVMPHHPFFYDSTGKQLPLELLQDEFYYDKNARISYLKYTNNELLKLIDEIKISSREPVIFLVGDHGIREIKESFDQRYLFINLNAILLPERNYDKLYKGMSNVNIFRFFLNEQFQQKLPLLEDSTIMITD